MMQISEIIASAKKCFKLFITRFYLQLSIERTLARFGDLDLIYSYIFKFYTELKYLKLHKKLSMTRLTPELR